MDQDTAPSIPIFRPGTFTSMEGVDVTLSLVDLKATAAAYDPATDPAPLVIGHPRTDDPAWGWVAGLEVQDGALVAQAEQIEPAFAETVRAGRYRRVSARFYPPTARSNPKPGTWYLKHVGFLGAQAPAVKGLGTVQFADDDAESLTLVPVQEKMMTDKMTPANEVSFAERQAELDRREQEIAQREKDAETASAKARHEASVSFAEGLVSAGKLPPAAKALVVGVHDALDQEEAVSFAEAGEMTPAAAFRKLFDGAKPLVSFAEHGKTREADEPLVSFAAPDGYQVDPAQAALYAKAKVLQLENPKLSITEAVARVRGG